MKAETWGIDFYGECCSKNIQPWVRVLKSKEADSFLQINGAMGDGGARWGFASISRPPNFCFAVSMMTTGAKQFSKASIVLGAAGAIPNQSNMLSCLGSTEDWRVWTISPDSDPSWETPLLISRILCDSSLAFSDSSEVMWSGLMRLRNFNIFADSLRFGTTAEGLLRRATLTDSAFQRYCLIG